MIRKKMIEIMAREASACDLKDLVAKFIPEAIGKEIEKSCQGRCAGMGVCGVQESWHPSASCRHPDQEESRRR